MAEETSAAIVASISVTYPKLTRIASGHFCTTYYDCARLHGSDLARLAAEATGHLADDSFDVAVGLAYGGIAFAASIAGGKFLAILQTDGVIWGPSVKGRKVLIVDDVVCAGRRIADATEKLSGMGAIVVGSAAIIDRSNGSVGTPERPLWSAYQTSLV